MTKRNSTGSVELRARETAIARRQVRGPERRVVGARSLPGRVARDVVVVDGRVGDDQDAPGPQHARRLRQDRAHVDRIVKRSGRDHRVEAARAQGQRFEIAGDARDPLVAQRAQTCVAGIHVQRGDAERAGQPPRHPAVAGAEIQHADGAGRVRAHERQAQTDGEVVEGARAPRGAVASGDVAERQLARVLGIGGRLPLGEAHPPVVVREAAERGGWLVGMRHGSGIVCHPAAARKRGPARRPANRCPVTSRIARTAAASCDCAGRVSLSMSARRGRMERVQGGSSGSSGAGARSADLAPPWLEWGLLAVALGLFIWRGFLPAWRHLLSDFPNYYLAGRLFRDGVPLDRLYDWEWLQRQKDHLGLDQPLVGFVPLTMFSALLAAPLTSLSALAAKHVWLVFNLLLLPAIAWLLRAITGQPLRRVALIGLLAVVPLRTNFQFGQQHLFVLFLLTVATWCYFRGHDVSAGAVLAVAAAVKLYPAGFVLLLVRKRRWRALAGMAVAGLLIAAAGIALFGVEPWSVFAREIVPRAVLRAEVTDPYDTHMSSLAGMLRRLLIFEPELNPHPLVHAPAAFAVLQPLFAAAILATGLWLLTSGRASPERERLDWAATLAFILLLSTGTPTYHLCALILAAVLAVDCQLRMQWVTGARALLIAFTVLCLVTQDSDPRGAGGVAHLHRRTPGSTRSPCSGC